MQYLARQAIIKIVSQEHPFVWEMFGKIVYYYQEGARVSQVHEIKNGQA